MNNLKDRKLYFKVSFFFPTMENLRCLNPANIRLDEDVLKTFWTRPQRNILLSFKTSWGRLEDIIARRLKEDVLQIRLEDVFEEVLKTSRRRLEDVFGRGLANATWRRLEDVLEDEKLLRWKRLQDVFKTFWKTRNVCWELCCKWNNLIKQSKAR